MKPKVSKENKKALANIVHEKDLDKILILEKEYKTKKELARIFDYNYTALCRMMRKEKSLLFNRKIEKIKCSHCDGDKTIRFKYFRKLNKYQQKVKKPFCSRKCYWEYLSASRKEYNKVLKISFDRYKYHSLNKIPYPVQWPDYLPYSEKQFVHRNDIVMVNEWNKMGCPNKQDFVKYVRRETGYTPSWVYRCLKAGVEEQKKRNKVYNKIYTSLKDLRKINDLRRSKTGKSIYTFISEVFVIDPEIGKIYKFEEKKRKDEEEHKKWLIQVPQTN